MKPPVLAAFPPDHYLNRELTWLNFNARVLEEATDATNPWLERLKFLCIFSSNLDEFFEVRVAGLQQQVYAGIEPQDYGADGLGPSQQLTEIDARAHRLVAEQYRVLLEDVVPGLASSGIHWVRIADLTKAEREFADRLFATNVYPVLTPLAIDPGHPFPHVHNKSLNVALLLEGEHGGQFQELFAVVQVPSVLDRVVVLPGAERTRFLLLEDVIAAHLSDLFGGFRVMGHTVFRVTRNTDLEINEDEAEDLLESIEESLRQRMRGDAVRLEISADADERFVQMLGEAFDLEARDVYRVPGPVDLTPLTALNRLDGYAALHDEPLVPRVSPAFAVASSNPFDVIRAQDVLLHHPYESFGAVVDFLDHAADDPQVLAIKLTLYRASGASPIVTALTRAAQNGKQVTALVELRARFDEQNNIVWARSLEQSGVNVVYGVVGLKTHCKVALVVRRESDGIRRYVHLATGNYNPTTARVYTDLGLFTAKREFGEDASELFNLLTGYSQRQQWKKLIVAPVGLRERVIQLIDRERAHAEAGRPARIFMKVNALVEPSVIDALYRASQAGVTIDAVVRGICCLRPGLPGVSERIRVVSVVDKFLEHSRIFFFENAGSPEVFAGSADWMPRNFFRRIELMFPIEEPRLKTRITDEIMRIQLSDNVKARRLETDGTYTRVTPGEGEMPVRSQVIFQTLARGSARESGEMALPFIPPLEAPAPDVQARKRKRKGRVRIGRPRDVTGEPGSAAS